MFKLPSLSQPKQKVNLLIAAMFVMLQLPFLVLVPGIVSARNPKADPTPPANNGTLKVHEFGTPRGEEDNDPKVCAFNFEGFEFDANQSGVIKIEPQGNDSGTTDTASLSFGPTDETGYAETVYLNNGSGTDTLDDGHYKSTLFGKDVNDEYTVDLKAKSKVFKVQCKGSLTVNKVLLDAEGTVIGGNAEANEIKFRWGYDSTPTNRAMGTSALNLDAGSYDVTENVADITGYSFVGYFLGEGNCGAIIRDDTVLPVTVAVTNGETTTVTLCNQKASQAGSIIVNKTLLDANGNVVGGNAEATALGFEWVLNGSSTSNLVKAMGESVSLLEPGAYQITENIAEVEGYEFVGYYEGQEGSCDNVEEDTVLPISVTIVADTTTHVTLCNQEDEEEIIRENGRVLGESTTVTRGQVLGASTQVVAPAGGVNAGGAAGSAAGSLFGLGSSLTALGYGVASLRKKQ